MRRLFSPVQGSSSHDSGGVSRSIALGLIALALAAPGIANSQQQRGPRVEGAFAPPSPVARAQVHRRLPPSVLPSQTVLDRVESARLAAERQAPPDKTGVPLKIGFHRPVPALGNTSQTSANLRWTPVDGGQIAAISITSPEARGTRFGLLVDRLPSTALLRFYALGSDQVFEASGKEILESIARNAAAGERGDDANTWWSPFVEGEEATVEIEVPGGTSRDQVRIAIPRVSHFFASPLDPNSRSEKIGESDPCEVDSICEPAWSAESFATARMVFSVGSSQYLCTGTLMNDQDASSLIPYFLSANHCISTQSSASSLQTYWFYRSTSCGSGDLNPGYQTLTGGATLLYHASATDTSFMRLNQAPPAGAFYAGWSADLPALGTGGTGIHHPSGDAQKISFGAITGYLACTGGGATYSCSSASAASANHLNIVWNSGVTEGGSSGSGLWINSGGSHYLVGQLHGGQSYCSTPTLPDNYGRFDLAYYTALSQWLGAVSTTYVLDVSKSGTGGGTVSSSPAGINCGATCSASFASGTSVTLTASPAPGSVFAGWSGSCSGTGACVVGMTAARSVAATFNSSPAATLSVTKAGTGSGTVTSSPAGIDCGLACNANFTLGSLVTLSAVPASGSTFSGWGGPCSGTGNCSFSLNGNTTVTASFSASQGGGGSITALSQTNLFALTGAVLRYSVPVPSGARNLVIRISGGTGNADLYVRAGQPPTTSLYDCRPFLQGNEETCSFGAPTPDTYHIMLNALSSFSGVTLTASYQLGAADLSSIMELLLLSD